MDDKIIKEIVNAGKKFYETANDPRATRYKSWDHCHNAFKEAKEAKEKGKQIDIDYLCLQLSTYLASWGMFRNSFLLWCDYKVHEDVIKDVILNKEYSELWDIKIDEYNDSNIELLNGLIDKIKKCYTNKRNDVIEYKKDVLEQKLKEEKSNEKNSDEENSDEYLSNTLISKILLGTIACVPAYDRYFISAVRKTKITTGIFNLRSIEKLVDNKNTKEILENLIKEYPNYPQMKLLDSCLWQYGYNLEKNEEADKK